MSRSRKGSKGPGYDYWSRRPMSGSSYGPAIKRITHRVERAGGDAATRRELADATAEPEREDDICPGCPQCECVKCGGHIGSTDGEVFACIECEEVARDP